MQTQSPFVLRIEMVLDRVRAACIFAASIALVILIITFGWLVFGRYVLNSTPTWVEQLALVLVCYIAFLGAAAGIKEDFHIGVTLFRDLLPAFLQKLIIILIDFILAAFGALMLYAGITLMIFGWDTMLPMLNIPETFLTPKMFIPESFKTLAITSCGGLVMLFAGARGLVRILTFQAWSPGFEHKDS